MEPSVETAQERAEAMGLSGAKAPMAETDRDDPRRLLLACAVTPAAAGATLLVLASAWALLLALPLLGTLAIMAPPMRRYFIAFSPQNGFPRNLPAFARWAALYSGAMLIMIALPPVWSPAARGAAWVVLASLTLLYPLTKTYRRARAVWR